jgi:hypothetical protein
MHLSPLPMPEPEDLSVAFLIGQRLVEFDDSGVPHTWMLKFDRGARLGIETLWRIVTGDRVALTSEDHQQQFGLPAPIDAGAALRLAIRDKPIRVSSCNRVTGDLILEYDDDLRLEIIVTSAGYENWNLMRADGHQIIAIGGGAIAAYGSTAAG